MELDKFILDDDSYIEIVDRKSRNDMQSITQELTKLTDEYKKLQGLNISSFVEEASKINTELINIKATMSTKESTEKSIINLKEELYGPGSTEALDTIKELANAIEGNQDILKVLNDSIGNKLDKVTPEFDGGATRGYVYFIDPFNNQTVRKVQIQANADTIPLRNPNGNFYVTNPTLPYECTNLGTVSATQGTSAPTEDTKALYVGELYYDETNNKMYMCFGIDTINKKYTWTQIIRATDYAGNSVKGVVDVRNAFGLNVDAYGRLATVLADETTIAGKTDIYKPIVSNKIDYAVKQGLAYSKLAGTGFAWTDDEKASARELLNTLKKDTDKQTWLAGKHTLYGSYYDSAGMPTQSTMYVVSSPISGRLPMWTGDKTLRTETPINDLDCINKAYAEDNFISKTTDALKIYGTDSQGNQVAWIFRNTNNTKNTVAGRDSNGNIQVGTAINPTDAVNKEYVDGLVGDINAALEAILGV